MREIRMRQNGVPKSHHFREDFLPQWRVRWQERRCPERVPPQQLPEGQRISGKKAGKEFVIYHSVSLDTMTHAHNGCLLAQ